MKVVPIHCKGCFSGSKFYIKRSIDLIKAQQRINTLDFFYVMIRQQFNLVARQ